MKGTDPRNVLEERGCVAGRIRITRDLIRAGQLLKVEVLDQVIVGHGKHASLRELGLFP